MIPTPPQEPEYKPVEGEVLTEAEARELRRRRRRAQRTQHEEGLRILRASLRHVGKGRPEQGIVTLMRGFGSIIIRAALGRGKP